MDPTSIIPHYQALPFPAPEWLLQTLLVLGFFLHVVPMNVVLGGGLTAGLFMIAGQGDKNSYQYRIGAGLACALPLFISFAITQGIVPLLFVQLLYGPMFYTSSILMAAPWFAIIFLLLIAYYSSYVVIYRYLKNEKGGMAPPLILFAAGLIFLFIAYLFTANMTLMLTPEKWLQMYQQNQHGLNLPHDKQIMPRLLHSFVASIAVTGLTIGCFGLVLEKKDPEYGTWLIKKGSLIFLILSVIQVPVGIWFLMSLPAQIVPKFLGQDLYPTIAFGASMGLALIAILCTAMSSATGSALTFKGGLVAAVLTILSMVVTRHFLRLLYTQPFISPDKVPVNTQWDLLSVFILSAVGLIVYLTWLVKTVWKAHDEAAAAAASIKPNLTEGSPG